MTVTNLLLTGILLGIASVWWVLIGIKEYLRAIHHVITHWATFNEQSDSPRLIQQELGYINGRVAKILTALLNRGNNF